MLFQQQLKLMYQELKLIKSMMHTLEKQEFRRERMNKDFGQRKEMYY